MNFEYELRNLCQELIGIEDREWKPVRVFRREEEAAKDEARHDLASEIANKARAILAQMP